MSFRRILVAFSLALALTPAAWCQNNIQLFPIADVKPGLKGVGRTIFEGDKIEEFQVEILGILSNVLAPKHDLILARLSGGPLEKTGVIAGMSGSPVYIDGKLVGAVAISFPFSKEPLAGITPIKEMLQVVPEAKGQSQAQAEMPLDFRMARTATGLRESARLIPQQDFSPESLRRFFPARPAELSLPALQLPLRFGGFAAEALEPYLPLFRQMGFEPMMGGALSGGESSTPVKAELEPGSMISMLLVRGDLNLGADCTITYRQGNNLYACGHHVLSMGPAQIPFAPAHVLVTVPSIASSFKLDAPGQVVGTIRQDRFDAIYGVVGEKNPPMIPVTVQIQSTLNTQEDYKFEVIQEPFLSPVFVNLAFVSTLGNTERALGASTLEVKGKIRLAGAESVDFQDVLSGEMGTAALAGSAVAVPLTYLMGSGFPDLHIEGVDLSVKSTNERSLATLEQVWSTKSEVRPGDHIEVFALLRLPGGQAVTQKIPVDIPESVSDKALMLAVGGGANINALQFRLTPPGSAARDIHQLVKALNRMRRNNRLYALLMAPQRSFTMQGDEYPSPPPSLVQTFMADPAAASSISFSGTSVVGDFEAAASSLMIRGQKTLLLKVVGPGL
ncbi:MAG: SpoIVB peptidase S55 domain-containing protein [Terriglobia bacterium]